MNLRHKEDDLTTYAADAMEEHNFIILNHCEGTGLNCKTGNLSHIDLTFATPELAGKANWYTLDECCGSDHIIIEINFGMEIFSEEHFSPKWNFSKSKMEKNKIYV